MRLFLSLIIMTFNMHAIAKDTPIDKRLEQEEQSINSNFSITPHKPTYVMPFSFNDKINSYDLYMQNEGETNEMQQLEMEFQISFKMPLLTDIAELPLSLYFAYTQVSFWQAYNTDESSPFRETNYEPEVFVTWQKDHKLNENWTFKLASLGYTHQSNGRSDPISRSWNRLNGNIVIANTNLAIALTPWYRFEEPEDKDNNINLLDYYGHGKITVAYKLNNNTFSLMSRNNLESGFSKGALEMSWGFPIHQKLRGYVKIFSGYGNSLIEYNQYTNTIGLGIILMDWL
ncbi:MAG: phospholipase A [Psychromonas sp.]|nr:phospholipase A [Alteromonadales bacterium]MCP5077353.1 phospholipase A [Psychromonas sp.]